MPLLGRFQNYEMEIATLQHVWGSESDVYFSIGSTNRTAIFYSVDLLSKARTRHILECNCFMIIEQTSITFNIFLWNKDIYLKIMGY